MVKRLCDFRDQSVRKQHNLKDLKKIKESRPQKHKSIHLFLRLSLDKRDPNFEACARAATLLPVAPLLTTFACFTEAMYMLGKVGGYSCIFW